MCYVENVDGFLINPNKIVGKGNYLVYKCSNNAYQEKACVKKLLHNVKSIQQIEKEINISIKVKEIGHPNLIQQSRQLKLLLRNNFIFITFYLQMSMKIDSDDSYLQGVLRALLLCRIVFYFKQQISILLIEFIFFFYFLKQVRVPLLIILFG